jgi:hypothetical protein
VCVCVCLCVCVCDGERNCVFCVCVCVCVCLCVIVCVCVLCVCCVCWDNASRPAKKNNLMSHTTRRTQLTSTRRALPPPHARDSHRRSDSLALKRTRQPTCLLLRRRPLPLRRALLPFPPRPPLSCPLTFLQVVRRRRRVWCCCLHACCCLLPVRL